MSMNIDKPLDDMIAEKKKSRGPRRPRGPRNAGAAQAPAAPKAAVPAAAAAAAPLHVGDKIIVSNLPTDVNEQQVKELFTTTIGPIRTCSLAYNAQGLSKGTATVHFVKAEHATAAYQQYNKRMIDGKRAMRVEIVIDPARAAAKQPLTARIAAAPAQTRAAQSVTVAAAGGSAIQNPRQPRQPRTAGAGGAGGRRGGRRGGARGARGAERPKVTAESLDAEMSDYQAQAAGANGGAEASA
ncbi:THO complex subunit 4 [Rhodotorula toruloides]|uniref:THO complex subunit 4 n=1 Tax=Rhodotorula toruloides TaxID=5286 RepID=A0A511KRW5_RHOTO|nr:THO complex subunit 4 [Rhodotorula toruloides]